MQQLVNVGISILNVICQIPGSKLLTITQYLPFMNTNDFSLNSKESGELRQLTTFFRLKQTFFNSVQKKIVVFLIKLAR